MEASSIQQTYFVHYTSKYLRLVFIIKIINMITATGL